jgi:hypothetical protein
MTETRNDTAQEMTAETQSNPLETPSTTQVDNRVIGQINAGTLRYAKASPTTFPVRGYRSRRLDWYEIGVICLVLISAAICSSRLIWAIQP